jgi:glycogen operon protein
VTDVWPGRPAPLGATWDGAGTNVAVHSAYDLSVCLFDGDTETRLATTRTGSVRHCYLPGVGPGQRYGLRTANDPDRLLTDPYAQQLDGGLRWDAAVFAAGDTAGHVPRSVVVDPAYDWGDEPRPHHDHADRVFYELHVRGFTRQLEGVPAELRGTYAGLAHPAAIAHLQRLGVTTVELLPIHHFVDEPHLQLAGLTNYWGYNSLGWFAPHSPYAAGDPVPEVKAMVRALHAAGIEVFLDVVYNHTAEGEPHEATLCWRGLDPAYYRGTDVTGCGNTVDTGFPPMLATVTDSLRHWVTEFHVDGFRFDLAPALSRTDAGFDDRSAFLSALAQDPVLRGVTLVAEPWDVGPGGYALGRFPSPWSEWNGRFRDSVRDVWRGAPVGVADLAYRLTGSSDLFAGRAPQASVNVITVHDGFTLSDLVSYDHKHNEANGEDNHDGTGDNRSWNGGAEGPTDDPDISLNRRSRRRSMLATLLLSAGVPLLTAGDELGRTQGGNNNAYCQDNAVSWLDWSRSDTTEEDVELVAGLVALRRAHPVLRQRAFFTGTAGDGRKDVGWFGADGQELTDWTPHTETLGVYLDGGAIRTRGPRGEPVTDDSFLLWLNPQPVGVTVKLPPWSTTYARVLDTAADEPWTAGEVTASLPLAPWSVVVLQASALQASVLPASVLPA